MDDWWTIRDCADHCGILLGTWRDYVAKGFAPPPDDPDEGSPPNRRRPRWRPQTVITWHAARPSQRAASDPSPPN